MDFCESSWWNCPKQERDQAIAEDAAQGWVEAVRALGRLRVSSTLLLLLYTFPHASSKMMTRALCQKLVANLLS
jgi:hypothetical protein